MTPEGNEARAGTRFRLFSQAPYLSANIEPETVWISTPAGQVMPGPSDDRAYVIDPVGKPMPYGPAYMPPFDGPIYHPALPDKDGHFDYLPINCREFRAAHMFASIRFTLDVWERYLGRAIQWHFAARYTRLELITFINWDNAHSGFGFIEAGYGIDQHKQGKLYNLNFDVMAHEIGHSIIFAEVGVPEPGLWTDQYRSFHESASDLVALIAALHLKSVQKRLLDTTHGNLYSFNELGRIGELSDTEQIRLACNDIKMSAISGLGTHGQSLPLTGAVFDVLVEIFQSLLVESDAIDAELAELSYGVPRSNSAQWHIQLAFTEAYLDDPALFHEALERARDHVGQLLVQTWTRLPATRLDYRLVVEALFDAENSLGNRYRSILMSCIEWRELPLPEQAFRPSTPELRLPCRNTVPASISRDA